MDQLDFWALATEHCTQPELDALRARARGLTYDQAARELGITRHAYKRRMQRATERMRSRKYPRSGAHIRRVEDA